MKFDTEQDFFLMFPNERVCIEFIEKQRWNGKPECPHCGSEHHYRTATRLKSAAVMGCKDFKCKDCGKKYTAISGTELNHLRLPIQKYLLLLFLCITKGKYNSSVFNAMLLGVTQKTTWRRVNVYKINDAVKYGALKGKSYEQFRSALQYLLKEKDNGVKDNRGCMQCVP